MKLTAVQEAYLIGREKQSHLGGTACHVYLEFDGAEIDCGILQEAWSDVVQHEPAMRQRIRNDGTAELADTPLTDRVLYFDFSGKTADFAEAETEKIRQSFSHRKMRAEEGHLCGLMLVQMPDRRAKLIFDLDLLMCDVYGFQVVLDRLAQAYAARTLTYPNPSYLHNPAEMSGCRYKALTAEISAPELRRIREKSLQDGTGIFAALLTLFGEAVSRMSEQKHFVLNVPLFRIADRAGKVTDATELLFVPLFYDTGADIRTLMHNTQRQLTALQNGEQMNSKPSGDLPAFVFSYTENVPLVPVMFESLLGGVSYMISQTPDVAVDCQIFETIHGLRADWVYPDGLFDEAVLRDQFAHYIKRITEVWENE
ncbi:MAG: hypothetical protein K5705_13270 [Oscillospiraceae bacterium]|nr:hypothetical protein [Oscillospiraceae bacterium]